MDPAISDPQPKEARMLAAIVFTDVVGFSKLASQNEARVYVALQRDMGVMTNLCRAHGGQVLNTMGDGMLLCFTSAVDAMSCAVEIQRTLYNQSLSLPNVEVLHHRIGVHLGDVIMNGDNVFGDGVNIAARLQTMAKPDAVCFSSTVYEIIKNKMKIDAMYLGPQTLKNLGEPVKVWQIPPLATPVTRSLADDPPASLTPAETTGASGFKAVAMVLASIVLLGGLGFGITRLKPPAPAMTDRPKSNGKKDTPPKSTIGGETAPSSGGTSVPVADKAAILAQIEDLKKQYRFDEIVTLVNSQGTLIAEELAKKETYEQLGELERFRQNQMSSATMESSAIPIPMLQLPNGAGPAKVFASGADIKAQSDRDGIVTIGPGGRVTPEQYIQIVSGLAILSTQSGTAPPELPNWLQLFSKEFGVSVPT